MELTGKTAIVTGANTGIGFETALELYRKGARVIVACRNRDRGRDAISRMQQQSEGGELIFRQLDLSSLESVKEFADKILGTESRLDLLINNAGVMIPPPSLSKDGYEIQFAVNFIGHFALTGRLFPLLNATPGSRIVTLSSLAHRGSAIDFDNFK